MTHRDTEVDPVPRLAGAASAPAPVDWHRLYVEALERAEAAEARAEDLERAMSSLRTDLGYWKSQFRAARRKRLEAVEDATRARRAAKDAFSLQAEARRLRELPADAGVESRRCSVVGLRREVARLRKAPGRSRRDEAATARLSQENAQLRRTVGRRETETAKLRATRAVHSKALYGRRSEMRERPGSGRPRGQARGAPGHGRTPRPGSRSASRSTTRPRRRARAAFAGSPARRSARSGRRRSRSR